MGLFQISGKCGNHLLLGVQRYIQDELYIDGSGSTYHIFVDRVVFQDTGCGKRAGNRLVGVILIYSRSVADAGKNTFSSA